MSPFQRSAATVILNSSQSGAAPFTGVSPLAGTALPVNPRRISLFVQNLHSGGPLYVALGTGAASAANFNVYLGPLGVYQNDYWRGQVGASGFAWNAFDL